jgi:hypothetical protein
VCVDEMGAEATKEREREREREREGGRERGRDSPQPTSVTRVSVISARRTNVGASWSGKRSAVRASVILAPLTNTHIQTQTHTYTHTHTLTQSLTQYTHIHTHTHSRRQATHLCSGRGRMRR